MRAEPQKAQIIVTSRSIADTSRAQEVADGRRPKVGDGYRGWFSEALLLPEIPSRALSVRGTSLRPERCREVPVRKAHSRVARKNRVDRAWAGVPKGPAMRSEERGVGKEGTTRRT